MVWWPRFPEKSFDADDAKEKAVGGKGNLCRGLALASGRCGAEQSLSTFGHADCSPSVRVFAPLRYGFLVLALDHKHIHELMHRRVFQPLLILGERKYRGGLSGREATQEISPELRFQHRDAFSTT